MFSKEILITNCLKIVWKWQLKSKVLSFQICQKISSYVVHIVWRTIVIDRCIQKTDRLLCVDRFCFRKLFSVGRFGFHRCFTVGLFLVDILLRRWFVVFDVFLSENRTFDIFLSDVRIFDIFLSDVRIFDVNFFNVAGAVIVAAVDVFRPQTLFRKKKNCQKIISLKQKSIICILPLVKNTDAQREKDWKSQRGVLKPHTLKYGLNYQFTKN